MGSISFFRLLGAGVLLGALFAGSALQAEGSSEERWIAHLMQTRTPEEYKRAALGISNTISGRAAVRRTMEAVAARLPFSSWDQFNKWERVLLPVIAGPNGVDAEEAARIHGWFHGRTSWPVDSGPGPTRGIRPREPDLTKFTITMLQTLGQTSDVDAFENAVYRFVPAIDFTPPPLLAPDPKEEFQAAAATFAKFDHYLAMRPNFDRALRLVERVGRKDFGTRARLLTRLRRLARTDGDWAKLEAATQPAALVNAKADAGGTGGVYSSLAPTYAALAHNQIQQAKFHREIAQRPPDLSAAEIAARIEAYPGIADFAALRPALKAFVRANPSVDDFNQVIGGRRTLDKPSYRFLLSRARDLRIPTSALLARTPFGRVCLGALGAVGGTVKRTVSSLLAQ